MEKALRTVAILLLLMVGISAMGGGWMLVRDPSGGSMQFPIELLETTPFSTYLIPGILLFLGVGALSLYIALLTYRKNKNAPFLIVFQGVMLFVWLTVELIMNMDFFVPMYHMPLYGMALVLVLIGSKLKKE